LLKEAQKNTVTVLITITVFLTRKIAGGSGIYFIDISTLCSLHATLFATLFYVLDFLCHTRQDSVPHGVACGKSERFLRMWQYRVMLPAVVG